MAVTGSLQFMEQTVDKTREWLHDLNEELNWDDYEKSYHALRAVLHVLRDRVPPAAAVHLGAQLPMLLRGMYYEGWRINETPRRIRSAEEFLQDVSREFGPDPSGEPQRLAEAVFTLLNHKISTGEVDKVRANLPQGILQFWH